MEWWDNSPLQTSHSLDGWRRLFFEPRDDFDMRRVAELIDRRDRREPVAAVDQKAHVARERRRIARHRDDDRHAARGELARLRLRALARRIEHDGVEVVELRRTKRILEQIAPLDLDRLEAGGGRGGALERGERRFVVVDRGDARAVRRAAARTGRCRQNRSATFLAPAQAASTSRASAASPSAVACRNAAGGNGTVAVPIRNVGARCCAISSPWRVRRARSVRGGDARQRRVSAAVSGPEPRTSTSRPASVAVTWMSSGFLAGTSASAIAQAA